MAPLTPDALKDVQGWIVHGFAHLPTSAYLFLHVNDGAKARTWLRQLIPEVLTAEEWPLGDDGERIKPPTASNIAFTSTGLLALDVDKRTLDTFPGPYREGMPARQHVLGDTGDSAPEHWQIGGPKTPEVHALLVLQAPDPETVEAMKERQLARIKATRGGLEVLAEEGGTFTGTEHFGFADGIANPLIEGTKGHILSGGNVVSTGEFILGYWNSYGLYPPGPAVPRERDPDDVLAEFPGYNLPGCKDLGRSGSYLVYRKLRQDVPGFWSFIAEQAAGGEGEADPAVVKWLASKLTGRWPSGCPLVLSPDRDDPAIGRTNLYSYYPTDPDGLACPIGAHTRRANPIDSIAHNDPASALKSTDRHRLMRRAVYFGSHLVTPESFDDGKVPTGLQDDGEPRGMHFFAINADIQRQFEFVQESWCNSDSFNGVRNNKDPIIGANDGTGTMTIPQKPLRREVSGYPRFVTVMGGAYLFLPGMAALRYLAAG